MSEFDDWREEQERIHNDYDAENAWYAGQQSQQAKIDELQARVDATEKWIESNKKNIPLSEWHGYTTEEYVDADEVVDILKGGSSE